MPTIPLLPLSSSLALAILLVLSIAGLLPALGCDRVRVRAAFTVLCVTFLLLGFGFFAWSRGQGLGVTIVWILLPLLFAVLLALLPALVIHHAPRLLSKHASPSDSTGPRLTRRAALALPVCAGAGVALGFRGAARGAELRELTLNALTLHRDLHGLRILHLSDLHLGTGLDTRDLVHLMARARQAKPDIVVLTGDVADKLESLVRALPILEALAPRLGTYAVLGNHEYLSGARERMIDAYADSRVTLLINQARVLRIGQARLGLLGIDDPFGKDERGFFERCLAECDPVAETDFRVLLSHRPEALDAAAARGVDLVLSGHTHGGQIGWWGRSLFERLGVAHRMWGFYRAGRSHLYTSAGTGDWFPFRVNCPREAPIITLASQAHDLSQP